MTYKEKLRVDNPELDEAEIEVIVREHCPSDFGYYDVMGHTCSEIYTELCARCWEADYKEDDDPVTETPTIKDSGERRQFETGAVRDMQEGKGRCDLMPLEVVARIIDGDAILEYIAQFKNTGDTERLYLALRHFAGAFDGLADMLLEVAKHFEEGAKKYGENNWQKGLPANCYIDSAVRHYLKWLRGDKDEFHDRAFVWNLMCCIWEVEYSPRAKKTSN